MNPGTGDIAIAAYLESLPRERRSKYSQPIEPSNLQPRHRAELQRAGTVRISKNTPCPCGSRKRFKNCCKVRT